VKVKIGGACFFHPSALWMPLTDCADSVKDDLKEVLSEEEYYLITAQDEGDDIEIEIKFKLWRCFRSQK